MIAAVLGAAVALGASTSPPSLALTVAPSHLALEAGAKATVRVGPTAGARLLLRASVTGLRLDARGQPQIGGKPDAAAWLKVTPQVVTVGPHGASFVVRSRRPAHARPGDHTAIVLLTGIAPGHRALVVGMRVGLVVTVAVRGRLTRRVAIVALGAQRKPGGRSLVVVTVANRGDVIESIGGPSFQLTLRRHGHVLARPRLARRKLLPRSRVILRFSCRVRGDVVARVVPGGPGRWAPARSFRLQM